MNLLKRRWFQFSLGTMLLGVTVFSVWLGWNYRQVDQRDFVLEAIEARGGSVRHVEFFRGLGVSPKPMPLSWSWMGAKPIVSIALPGHLYTEGDLEYAKWMFPEANVALYALPQQLGYRARPMPATTLQADADYTQRNLRTPEHLP